MFENRLPRKTFSSKSEEVQVTGERIHSEELRMCTDRYYLGIQVNENERR